MARNFKLELAYDGTDFSGWQVQPGRSTVQGALAGAIERVTREQVTVHGSGRTDAGVHALGQVSAFLSESPIPPSNLAIALNDALPSTIRVTSAEVVSMDFHPRKCARAKTYRYRIYREAVCSPFVARYVYHHPWPLDEVAMINSARQVEGEFDFTSFAAVDPDRARRIAEANDDDEDAPSNIRTIFSSTFRRQGDELIYEVRGTGFLHHMVRNLVGTFLLVGKGSLLATDIPSILAARERSANPGATAPASGLVLVNVEY
ncbi:MAG TPA: tRNA pseudouridine(38-40) synthase TruA [Terriglobales bacterium]|nr:tRNA pseudouridine(38-40) synthase TruA [Terriglobales bacterium]